jgi:hypothetical protein
MTNPYFDIANKYKQRAKERRRASDDPRNPLAAAGVYEGPETFAVDRIEEAEEPPLRRRLAALMPDHGEDEALVGAEGLPSGTREGDVLRVPMRRGEPQFGMAQRDELEATRRRLDAENRRRALMPASENDRNPLIPLGFYDREQGPVQEPERPMQALPARRITAPAPTPEEQRVGRAQLAQLERARAFSRGAETAAEPFVQFQQGRADVPLSLLQGGARIIGAEGAEQAIARGRERFTQDMPESDAGVLGRVGGALTGTFQSYLMPSRALSAAAQAAPAGSAVARGAAALANPLGARGLTATGRINRLGQLASGTAITAPLDIASSFSPEAAAPGLAELGRQMEGRPGVLPALGRLAGAAAAPFEGSQVGRTAFELLTGLVPAAAITGAGGAVSAGRRAVDMSRIQRALKAGDDAGAQRMASQLVRREAGEGVPFPGSVEAPPAEQVAVPRRMSLTTEGRRAFDRRMRQALEAGNFEEAARLQAQQDKFMRRRPLDVQLDEAIAEGNDAEITRLLEAKMAEEAAPVQGPQRWRGPGGGMQGTAPTSGAAPGRLQRAGAAVREQAQALGTQAREVAQEALQATVAAGRRLATEGDVGARAGVASGATSVGLTGGSFLTEDEQQRDALRAAALATGVAAGVLPSTIRRWTRYERPSAIGRAQEARMAQVGTRGVPEVRQLHKNFVANLRRRTGEPLVDNLPPVDRVDEAFAQRVARWYDNAQSAPNDPAVIRAYRAFAEETRAQYDMLRQAGIRFEFVTDDPYANSAEMIRDVAENGRLRVFKTAASETDPQVHPLLTNEENDLFRAVHDFFGHAAFGYQFGAKGEENAFRMHSAMYSPEARRAMATETRGQNSWVNYGPPAEINRAKPGSVFADQKVLLMPEEFMGDYTGPVRLSAAEGPQPTQAAATALRVAAPALAGAATGETTEERIQRGLAGAALGAMGPRLAGRGVGLSTADVNAPGFLETLYSRTQRVFENIPLRQPKKGEVWLARFQKAGAPSWELEYTGLREFLEGNAQRELTREEVGTFLSNRRIELTETMRGGLANTFEFSVPEGIRAGITDRIKPLFDALKESTRRVQEYDDSILRQRLSPAETDAFFANRRALEKANDEAYDAYETQMRATVREYLPFIVPQNLLGNAAVRGDIVRDRVVAMIEEGVERGQWSNRTYRAQELSDVGRGATIYQKYRAPEFRQSGDYFEVTVELPNQREGRFFQSPHWQGATNPMMHVRGSFERTPAGKLRMNIEEVQDDWAQKGRKTGFGAASPDEIARANKAADDAYDAQRAIEGEAGRAAIARINELTVETGGNPVGQNWDDWDYRRFGQQFLATKRRDLRDGSLESDDPWRVLAERHEEAIRRTTEASQRVVDLRQVVPDRPFKETAQWVELGLKRALYEAAKQGADEIVLATGDQAARAVGGTQEKLAAQYDELMPNVLQKIGRQLGIDLQPAKVKAADLRSTAERIAGLEQQRQTMTELLGRAEVMAQRSQDPDLLDGLVELRGNIAKMTEEIDGLRAGTLTPDRLPDNLRVELTPAARQRLLQRGSVPMGRVSPEALGATAGAGVGAVAGAGLAEPGDTRGQALGALTGAAAGAVGGATLARRLGRAPAEAMSDPERAVLKTIRVGPREAVKPTRFLTPLERTYTQLVSETFPLVKAARVIPEGPEDAAKARAKMIAMVSKAQGAPRAAMQFLEDALAPALQVARGDLGKVRALLKARRDLDIRNQGGAAKSTVPLADLEAAVAAGEANPTVAAAADAVNDLYRELLGMRYDAGLLSDEQATAIIASDAYYVPLIAEITQPELARGSRGTAWTVGTDGVARMNREAELLADTADPIELAVSAALRTFRDVGKARVANVLGDLADAYPNNPLVRVIPEKDAARAGDLTFSQIRNGESVRYEVLDSDLYEAIMGATPKEAEWYLKIAQAFKNLQTAGVTLAPAFAAANVIRDLPVAAMQRLDRRAQGVETAAGAALGAGLGAATADEEDRAAAALRGMGYGMGAGMLARTAGRTVRAMGSIMGDTKIYQDFLREGGSTEGFYVKTPKDAAEVLERLQRSGNFRPSDLLHFNTYMDALRFVGSIGEQAPRLAAYREAIEAGMSKEDAIARAQDLTLRFANIGKGTKGLASTSPFWNAKVQGWDKLVRTLSDKRTAAAGIPLILAPTLALWSVNKDNPEYWERPLWERNIFWLVPKEGGGFYRIPKPFEIGQLFASIPERMFDYAAQRGVIVSAAPDEGAPGKQFREALKESAASTFEGTLPVPQIAALPMQLYFNRDTFRDLPIIRRPGVLPEQQITPERSAIARQAAKLGLAPEAVDFVLRDVAGTLGQEALGATDALARRFGAPAPEPQPTTPVFGMFTRRFTTQNVGQSASESAARERLRALDKVLASERLVRRTDTPAEQAQFRRRYQSQLRTANRLSDLEAQLDKISAERREVARDRTLTFQQRQDKQARLRQRAQEISRKIQRIPD